MLGFLGNDLNPVIEKVHNKNGIKPAKVFTHSKVGYSLCCMVGRHPAARRLILLPETQAGKKFQKVPT